MTNEAETTTRAKQVIANWAAVDAKVITLDTRLSRLRSNHTDELRASMNREFSGEGDFPITPPEWDEADPKRVRDVRDLADKKLGDES